MKFVWSKQAKDDLDLILLQLNRISPKFSADFDEKVRSTLDSIRIFPKSGRIIPETQNINLREKLVGKYRLMYYIQSENQIEILGIIHGSRHFTPN